MPQLAQWGAGGTPTFSEFVSEWLAHMQGRVRPSTLRGYRCLLQLYALPTLGHLPLDALHPLALQRLYGHLLATGGPGGARLSTGTVLNLHRVLVQSLGTAVRWELLAANPAKRAEPPRPRRPEAPMVDPDLVHRILAAVARTVLQAPVAIALATGMRRGEILALRWSDLDPALTVARVRRTLQQVGELSFGEPKTVRSRRTVALPRFLHPYLQRQREDQRRRRALEPERWEDSDLVVDEGD